MQIREVKPGSKVTVIYRIQNGWQKEAITSSKGEVKEIDEYGKMRIEVDDLRGLQPYNLYDLTRSVFLKDIDMLEAVNRYEEELEEQERIRVEMRDEDE